MKDVMKQPVSSSSKAKDSKHWSALPTHSISENAIRCCECLETSQNIIEFQEHCKLNHASVAFCIPCGKPFKSQQGYIHHQHLHTGGTSCDICGKVVQSEYYLRRHKLTHTSERAFQCPSCGAPFKHKGNMTKHFKFCGNTFN